MNASSNPTPSGALDSDPHAVVEADADDAWTPTDGEADLAEPASRLEPRATARRARSAAAAGATVPAVADEQLAVWIEAIVERDERALAALYDATLSRVYGIVYRVVRRPALAEEVVEDTYFQVWRQAVRYDPARGRAMTWLLGMARSRAIDAVRREARFAHLSLDEEAVHEGDHDLPGGDDLLDVARGHADLHKALLLLKSQPRQLVALAFLRGLSQEEIANQTQLPLGTVKSQIRRALITLRQSLGDGAVGALAS